MTLFREYFTMMSVIERDLIWVHDYFESDSGGCPVAHTSTDESVGDALLLERKLLWSTRAKIDVQLALRMWGAIQRRAWQKVVLVLVRIPRCPALYGWELRQGS